LDSENADYKQFLLDFSALNAQIDWELGILSQAEEVLAKEGIARESTGPANPSDIPADPEE
jgi:hypothetical protein